ncbi:hypothetical protein TD95_002521 [Thielaviopsis punctulata]|uniref:RING-type domain-containing protein n=1 Tax=Thielaviopsis punctulata TaxID=72032 RepID=A0A0F4ZFC6_9PEZI|nr:hypothetical protein TD95_002521 [Thielaviopsis punctulata]
MKFGHDFKEALKCQGFPPHWIEHAIPYSQLKKCLKKILNELQQLGLDAETIQELLSASSKDDVRLKYDLQESTIFHVLQPKLSIFVRIQDGTPIDATLTHASRKVIQRLLAKKLDDAMDTVSEDSGNTESPDPHECIPECNESAIRQLCEAEPNTNSEVIKVPLRFDAQFFEMLQNEVHGLETIQAREEKLLTNEISELKQIVEHVARPSRFSRTDVAHWREIFQIYLEAQVFFSTYETSSGVRKSSDALAKLMWFQNEMQRRQLEQNFKRPQSREAFTRFVELNASILKNLQFQEINRMAITKILKKFDKRTSFGVSKVFPLAIESTRVMSGSIAKDMCAAISSQIVSVVPQLDDYLCPVCFAIAWRAVRLQCNHVYCIRCVIKMQRRHDHCPLCRADTVEKASEENMDLKLERFLRKNFRAEVKEKAIADEIETGVEMYGPEYRRFSCAVM